jgi:hypothetical protein
MSRCSGTPLVHCQFSRRAFEKEGSSSLLFIYFLKIRTLPIFRRTFEKEGSSSLLFIYLKI